MTEGVSWQQELKLAKEYAQDGGPHEWDEESMERCLRYATEKAQKEGIGITKEVERIRNLWKEWEEKPSPWKQTDE